MTPCTFEEVLSGLAPEQERPMLRLLQRLPFA